MRGCLSPGDTDFDQGVRPSVYPPQHTHTQSPSVQRWYLSTAPGTAQQHV